MFTADVHPNRATRDSFFAFHFSLFTFHFSLFTFHFSLFTFHLGKDGPTKTDEFLEKFQTAFDPPPPHFRKIMLRFFSGIHDQRSVYNGKNLQHKFLDWK